VNTPVVPLYQGITERFYILPNVVVALFGGMGAAVLLERAGRLPRARGASARAGAAFGGLLAAVAIVPSAVRNGPEVDMRRNVFTRDFGWNFAAGLPESALVLSTGDLFRNAFSYQALCLGRRADVLLVDEQLLSLPWYAEGLRRRGPEVFGRDGPLTVRGILDRSLRPTGGAAPRAVAAVRLVDPAALDAWRAWPMGLWSLVLPRATMLTPAAWRERFERSAAPWRLESLDREYPARSWETAIREQYAWALAGLEALREITGAPADAPGSGLRNGTPGRARAASGSRLRAPDRADFLAGKAAFLKLCLDDSLLAGSVPDSVLASRSLALSGEALALEPGNLGALRTRADLLRDFPAFRDPRAEASLRRQVLERRPGDAEDLVAYLRIVEEASVRPEARDPALLRDAIEAIERFVRLLEICRRISGEPEFDRARERWSRHREHFEEILRETPGA
jgi:hypothetical protein